MPWLKANGGTKEEHDPRRFPHNPAKWPKSDLTVIPNLCAKIAEKGDAMAQRDAAMTATIGAFGKRAGEVTRLQRKDIIIANGAVTIQFKVEKTQRPARQRCTKCSKVSSVNASFCPGCGRRLTKEGASERIDKVTAPIEAKKSVSLDHPLMPFLLRWLKVVNRETKSFSSYIFPRTDIKGSFPDREGKLLWTQPISRRAPWRIITQTVGEVGVLWPHRLRRLLATSMANMKEGREYVWTEQEVMEFFDWVSRDTYHGYILEGKEQRVKDVGMRSAELFKGEE